MQTIGIAELKAKLSEYLGRVKHGEELVVTDRGKPIARIVPRGSAASGRERLESLEAEGLARGPRTPLAEEFWDLVRPIDSESAVRALLEQEREEGR